MTETGIAEPELKIFTARLFAAGCVLPEAEVAGALDSWGAAPPAESRERLADYVSRRERGEPPAYILGGVRFLGAWVSVGTGAFIPRPWTEDVALVAIGRLGRPGIVVDIGTGAGPLAMTLATHSRSSQVFATENNEETLRWAHVNLDPLPNVTVLEGDLFAPLPLRLKGVVDLVVGCLPYVPRESLPNLPVDFLAYEPPAAFDGGGGGLDVVGRALAEGRQWLRPGAAIVLEIGAGQGPQARILAQAAGYAEVSVQLDSAGDDSAVVATSP